MATWPSTLPQGMGEGASLSPIPSIDRTPMEAGQERVRRVTRARLDLLEMRWRFSLAERTTFRAFWEDKNGANYGQGWFLMPVAQGGGLTTREVRFTTPPKEVALDNAAGWDVSASIEVRNA